VIGSVPADLFLRIAQAGGGRSSQLQTCRRLLEGSACVVRLRYSGSIRVDHTDRWLLTGRALRRLDELFFDTEAHRLKLDLRPLQEPRRQLTRRDPAARWNQHSESQQVCQQAGRDQQCACDQNHHAFGDGARRRLTALQLLVNLQPDRPPLTFCQPRTGDSGDQNNGDCHSPAGVQAELPEQREFDQGNQDCGKNESQKHNMSPEVNVCGRCTMNE